MGTFIAGSGQLPFFIEHLKHRGLFDGRAANPRCIARAEALTGRNFLGVAMLSIFPGQRRYAHIAALRYDAVNPPLLVGERMRL